MIGPVRSPSAGLSGNPASASAFCLRERFAFFGCGVSAFESALDAAAFGVVATLALVVALPPVTRFLVRSTQPRRQQSLLAGVKGCAGVSDQIPGLFAEDFGQSTRGIVVGKDVALQRQALTTKTTCRRATLRPMALSLSATRLAVVWKS